MKKILILPLMLTSMQAYASDKQEDDMSLKTPSVGFGEISSTESSLLKDVEEWTITRAQAPQGGCSRTDLFTEYFREDKVRPFIPGEIAYREWLEYESYRE